MVRERHLENYNNFTSFCEKFKTVFFTFSRITSCKYPSHDLDF